MSIEIDILNGDASWPIAEPLHQAVWGPHVVEKLPWGHVQIDAPEDAPKPGLVCQDLACHVGIYFRTATWDGRKVEIGGIGGVSTHPDCRGRGYATLALNAAIRTLRDHEAVRFAMLFCEPHNEAFYRKRSWLPFQGEVYCEQPEGRVRFTHMAPYVFNIVRAPTLGTIDLCGLPW
jgi:GNAT superfamily N-acetyltransferase